MPNVTVTVTGTCRVIAAALLLACAPLRAAEPAVFELRTYTTVEGRLPALQARFRDHTLRLFEKHGMRNIGYWIPTDRPNTLVYLLGHPSREAAAAAWQAFVEDPEWRTVYAESTKDGPILVENGIERQFMSATDYSPLQ